MEPQAPQPDYNFILNPETPPKKAVIGGNSTAVRLAVVAGGLVVLAIIALVIMKLLSSGSGFDKPSLLSVAQDQTAILQTITGSQNLTNADLKNAVATTKLTISTQQSELLGYLSNHKFKPNDKVLALKVSAQTRKQLLDAQASSSLDDTLKTILNDQLSNYQKDLSIAFNKAGPAGKKILKSHYEQNVMLLQQLNQQ